MIAAEKPTPESHIPNGKPAILLAAEKLYKENKFPKRMVLEDVPKIGYGSMPERNPTDYSLPGCLGNIIAYVEEREKQNNTGANILFDVDNIGYGQSEPIHIAPQILDEANRMIMNISGICYATIWSDDMGLHISSMERVNNYNEIIDRCMKYYGRDYTSFTCIDNYTDEIKRTIMASINSGHPVLTTWIAEMSDFSIITGYDDNGETLMGWSYSNDGCKEFMDNGMFVVKSERIRHNIGGAWNNTKVLIISGKNDSSLSDKEMFEYAVKTMELTASVETIPFSDKYYIAGIPALERWHNIMKDESNDILSHDGFLHLMILNIAEPRAYFTPLAGKFAKKYENNAELKKCFDDMEKITLDVSDYARAMWGVKDNKDISVSEKREKWCGLLKDTINEDKKLLEALKKVVVLLP